MSGEAYQLGRQSVLRDQMRDSLATRGACLQELSRPDPEGLYYSLDSIKEPIKTFYTIDTNSDGYVDPEELWTKYQPKDARVHGLLREYFKSRDLTQDGKINLAEFFVAFLQADARQGYKAARKFESATPEASSKDSKTS